MISILAGRSSAKGALILIACITITACNTAEVPSESELYVRVVEGNVFDTTPIYGSVKSLRLHRTGFAYACSECHTDFEHTKVSNRPQGEHSEILARFDHGRTIFCMSCHHLNDRNLYVDNIGQPLSSEKSEVLCARCHGLRYRDWEAGVHGRINGYWSEEYGERTKLTCVQCHDPHRPKFPLMTPSPPPIRSRLETDRAAAQGNTHD